VDGERALPYYGERLAIKPFYGLRTGVGVQGERGLLRIRHD